MTLGPEGAQSFIMAPLAVGGTREVEVAPGSSLQTAGPMQGAVERQQ